MLSHLFIFIFGPPPIFISFVRFFYYSQVSGDGTKTVVNLSILDHPNGRRNINIIPEAKEAVAGRPFNDAGKTLSPRLDLK